MAGTTFIPALQARPSLQGWPGEHRWEVGEPSGAVVETSTLAWLLFLDAGDHKD